MTKRFPPAPAIATPMLATRPSAEARQLLALRRSAGKHFIGEPGPSPEALDELLEIAARVPDHRRMTPWRFIVFEGKSREDFGQELARIRGETLEGAESRDLLEAAGLFLRAPVVVAVISAPTDDGRTPVWEQELSAGAVCYNLLLAANASGWAALATSGFTRSSIGKSRSSNSRPPTPGRLAKAKPKYLSQRGPAGRRSAFSVGRCGDRPTRCGLGRTGAAVSPGSRWP